MTPADRPLATQTVAPLVVPPKRPIVGVATPDDAFTVTIRSRAFTDDEEDVPGTSMLQLVHLLEQTAQTLRLAVDPDLQKTPMKRPRTKEKDLKVPPPTA